MKVIGHGKVKTIEKTKIGESDARKGILVWQKKKARKEDAQEYIEMPFLIFGKSGESFEKYQKDKNGKARYLYIEGDLTFGKAHYIKITDWGFPPYDKQEGGSSSGDNDGPF